jgi:hypothetical protein
MDQRGQTVWVQGRISLVPRASPIVLSCLGERFSSVRTGGKSPTIRCRSTWQCMSLLREYSSEVAEMKCTTLPSPERWDMSRDGVRTILQR